MEHDIFISYSRKDSQQVNSLIDRLRREIPGIRIWYDIEGVESADAFKRKIINAIENSNIVIFACSDNSLESEYCEKEVSYAKNVGKKVLPYLLPGSSLKGWLLFDFGNINCIHSSKEEEVGKMIYDLKRWTNHNNDTSDSSQSDGYQTTSNTIRSQLEFDPTSGEFKSVAKINGHEYVDLGLPSGLKWASCNIGASKPEEHGDYYAWGETQTKSRYTETNSVTYDKSSQWLLSNGYIEGPKQILTPENDAAHHKWGGSWRMPTFEEVDELFNYTTSQWTTLNGVKGRLFRSKRNGNSIFMPVGGWWSGDSVKAVGIYGYYWCSQPDAADNKTAFGFYFTSGAFQPKAFDRYCGRLIRPVSD